MLVDGNAPMGMPRVLGKGQVRGHARCQGTRFQALASRYPLPGTRVLAFPFGEAPSARCQGGGWVPP